MSRRRAFAPWLVTAAGLIASAGVYFYLQRADERALQIEFEGRCRAVTAVIRLAQQEQEDALYSLRNLFAPDQTVTREQFDYAAESLLQRHDGIYFFEWAKRVRSDERASVEQSVRAEGFPEFRFFDWVSSSDQKPTAPLRVEHFPVLFSVSKSSTHSMLGYDLAGSPALPNLLLAADGNRLIVSDRRPLESEGWSYALHLPIYDGTEGDDAASRRRALSGFVQGYFVLSRMIEGAIGQLSDREADILVLDLSAAPADQLLHFHPADSRSPAANPPTVAEFEAAAHHFSARLPFGNRDWEIHFRPAADWLSRGRSNAARSGFLACVLATALLGFYLQTIVRRESVIEGEVALRTAELNRTKEALEQDMRQREDAERQVRDSEVRLHAILNRSPNVIFLKDTSGRYLFVNEPCLRYCGRSADEMLGRSDHELFSPAVAESYTHRDAEVLATGELIEFEESSTPDAKPYAAIVHKFPLRDRHGRIYAICGMATDITERKQAEIQRLTLERQMLEAQRLESLGVLAGGIAHDFNNLLTTILANASLARVTEAAGAAEPQLEHIENAARRAANLCQQMLAYAGKGKTITTSVVLSELVRGTTALLEVSIHKNTRLTVRLAPDLPPVQGDPGQLHQIVMNLVINAAEAIGDNPGAITVTTFVREADASLLRSALRQPQLPEGLYVGLEVTDNGCGMPPEIAARIFEPFFTTKFSGRGLGLAAVLGIVQGHRGALYVESAPGAGTTFRLLLPAAAGLPSAAPAAPDFRISADRLKGTVLIVDDEAPVRLVGATLMRFHGLTVIEAPDGDTAVRIYKEHPEGIDVILLDLTMPGLSGEETLRLIRAANPTQRAVLMSGYSEEETMRRCVDLGGIVFLPKPFELRTLLETLRKLMHPG